MSLKRTIGSVSCSDSEEISRSLTAIELGKKPLATKMFDSTKGKSLTAMISTRRSSLPTFHKSMFDSGKRRSSVTFELPETVTAPACDEPPQKRRRFPRRNSKTAAMLFASIPAMSPSDLLDENESKEADNQKQQMESPTWDGGLEIAEELVRHLRLRRMSCTDNNAT